MSLFWLMGIPAVIFVATLGFRALLDFTVSAHLRGDRWGLPLYMAVSIPGVIFTILVVLVLGSLAFAPLAGSPQ